MNPTILHYPDPRLRNKSRIIDANAIASGDTQELLKHMTDAMVADDGVGIAAPQIGVFNRVILIAEKEAIVAYFNPEILSFSWKKNVDVEGCLSVPGVFGQVRRSVRVRVRYTTIEGHAQEEDAQDFRARVFQHEIDHLNGILFIDKVEKITQGELPKP